VSSSREDLALEIQVERLSELLRWREYLRILVEAVREVLGDVDVYVFGSAVMTMTVMSVAIMISTSSIELHPSSAKLSSTNSSTNNLSLTF
jgi:hypothetical protein